MFATFSAKIYVLPNGMGRGRVELFKNALIRNKAQIADESQTTKISKIEFLILVDEISFTSWDHVIKAIGKNCFLSNVTKHGQFKIVKSTWLSDCLKNKACSDTKPYEINNVSGDLKSETDVKKSGFKRRSSADYSKKSKFENPGKKSKPSADDTDHDSNDSFKSAHSNDDIDTNGFIYTHTYICSKSSKDQAVLINKTITDKLEQLCVIYQNTNDKYRALSYQKAISTVKHHPKPIESFEEIKGLHNIGDRIATQIWEIVQTGDLEKLNELNKRQDLVVIKTFTNIHGVGPTTAQGFYAQGYRSIEDLKTKAKLNNQQKIGLKYYDDLLVRIPRHEIMNIENKVKDVALSLDPGLIVQACGSYRRKKPTCGDVDILITHPDGYSHKGVFHKLIDLLHQDNFLTDDLVSSEESENQKKYMGICRLPGDNMLHRRLDIIVVPIDDYACAQLYFTGSAHFNRSMRSLARKMNMSLSEHGLFKKVVWNGMEKVNTGEKLNTPTEEAVFKHLNLTYRLPEERDF